jgi:hypothetical protein
MGVRSIGDLKAAISEQWKNSLAAPAALKVISAIEALEADEARQAKWTMAEILRLLDAGGLTPVAIAALTILTQSEHAIFRSAADFIGDDNQRHRLSSEDFQMILDTDTFLDPVSQTDVAKASERVIPFFELDPGVMA